MAIQKQSLFESIGPIEQDSSADGMPKTVIVSGKGGVGKSTVLASIAHKLNLDGARVLVADLDGSPSASDSFGMSPEVRAESKQMNRILKIRSRLHALLVRSILPPIEIGVDGQSIEDFIDDEGILDEYIAALNENLEMYTDEDKHKYLPILRLAAQSEFYGIPAHVELLSQIIHLTTLLRDNMHIATRHNGKREVKVQKVTKPDVLLLDTENTNRLMWMLLFSRQLIHSMKNMSRKGWLQQKVLPDNLKQYARTGIGKDPSDFIDNLKETLKHLFGEASPIVLVTNPGSNEVTQTLDEARSLVAKGKQPAHVLMNRWPAHPTKKGANAQEQLLHERLGDLGASEDWNYSRSPTSAITNVTSSDASFQETQLESLRKLAEHI